MISDYLKNQLNILQSLYVNSSSPICIVDNEMKIIWKNNVAEKKMTALNMIDSMFTLLSADVIQSVIQTLTKGIDANVMDGEQLYLHFLPIMDNENFNGAVAMFMFPENVDKILSKDITDRLISTLTRQVREPLNSIFSSVGVLNRSIENKSAADQQCLKSITQNSYQILRGNLILGEYLKYSYGSNTLSIKDEDISVFLKDFCTELKSIISSDVSLKYFLPEDGPTVATDIEKLTLVLANIVDNSCTFRRKDGVDINISLKCNDNNNIITIEDTGNGIPEDVLPNIFSPYYSYASKEIPFSGFGLGLTVSKLIVGHLGGNIAVSSKLNEGTTIAVTIPNRRSSRNNVIFRSSFNMVSSNRFSPLMVIMSNSCNCPEM